MKLKTQRGFVYEINQKQCTQEQINFLKSNMGSRRYIWNKYVELYQQNQLPDDYSYKPITTQMDWAKELDSCMFDNVKRDIKQAIKNHQKNPGHYGKPKFKRKKQDEDRYKTTNNPYKTKDGTKHQTISIQGNRIKLPKLSEPIPIIKHRCIPQGARILSATIRLKSSGKMFVSVLVEITFDVPDEKLVSRSGMIGLDYSSPDFYVDNYGHSPVSPHAYRVAEADIAQAMSERDCKVRGSKNYDVASRRVACAYEHEAGVRRDFTNKESSLIVKKKGLVFVEDINLRAMAGSLRFGKATNDNGFGMFREQLAYKLRQTGGVLVKVPRFFASTKLCSCCGHKLDKIGLDEREWVCPVCQSHHKRDVNAADNIEDCGLFGLMAEGLIDKVICSDGKSYDLVKLFNAGNEDKVNFKALYSIVCSVLPAYGTDVVTYVVNVEKCEARRKEDKTEFILLNDWWVTGFMTAKKKEWVTAQEAPASEPRLTSRIKRG